MATVDGAYLYIFYQFCLRLEITKLLPELFWVSLETAASCLMSLKRSGGAYLRFGVQLLMIYLIRPLSIIIYVTVQSCLWKIY